MKFICQIPAAQHYRLLSTAEGRFVYADRDTKALEIIAPTSEIWGRDWVVMTSRQQQKSDRAEYPYKLKLKLFEAGDGAEPATLERSHEKGTFIWQQARPLTAFYFPILGRGITEWVVYEFNEP
jgi:hypothetical protein